MIKDDKSLFDTAMGKIHDTGEKLGIIFSKKGTRIFGILLVSIFIILLGTITFVRAVGIGAFKKK